MLSTMFCPNICWLSISHCKHHPNIEKWWWLYHRPYFSAAATGKLKIWKMDEVKYREILQENVLQSARALGFEKIINLPNRQLQNHSEIAMLERLKT